jgi:hypothetical protein
MAKKTAILALGPFLPLTAGQVEVLEGDTSVSLSSLPEPVAPPRAPRTPTLESEATALDAPQATPNQSGTASPASKGANPGTEALAVVPAVVPDVFDLADGEPEFVTGAGGAGLITIGLVPPAPEELHADRVSPIVTKIAIETLDKVLPITTSSLEDLILWARYGRVIRLLGLDVIPV